MAIKIEMLKYFAAVAQHGSLSDAAAALNRTPSAVSMMLKQFEDHVGVPLFETTRKSRLTAIGALIYEEARREVIHFENSVSVIEGLCRSEIGYLRVVATPSVATNILPLVILNFTTHFPGVRIDIRDMDSALIAQELFHGGADIGIGTLPPIGDLTRAELFSDQFGVVCRKDHPLAQDWDQLTWRDVREHTFIANGLCTLIADPDFEPILKDSRLMVPSIVSLLGLVGQGIGISVLPQLAMPRMHENLVFLPLKDSAARRTVHISAKHRTKLMPAAREFLALVTRMKQDGTLHSKQ